MSQHYLMFQQASLDRQVVYCEQDEHYLSSPLIPTLETFLLDYPQWQHHVAIAFSSLSTKPLSVSKVPFYHLDKPDASLLARADICILLMNPDKQHSWLKEAHHHGSTPPMAKHIILIDPSKPLLPPSPPLLPVDEYKVTTIQHVDQLSSLLDSILTNIHGPVTPVG
ncbi:hypothetical protein BC941DRAFT_102983 [Chlamydoabsidia padenii]|nr:hypothetical protein BC941DRAFT_102983 [Chlamydoabsidia padenii]